jgi:hypothetical protein
MARQKTRQVGTAGLVTRYRNGIVMRTCRRCHQADTPPSWRAALREVRAHARDHQATDARDVGTPWGIPSHELPPTRHARSLRRLAIAVVVLVLTALALPALLGPLTGHAAPVVSTSVPGLTPQGYVPIPPGPPATDASGQWIPEPDTAPAPTSSGAGGR